MLTPSLFRRVNTKARGVHHRFGGDYRHQRHTKREAHSDATRQSMHGEVQRGLDYTPLFKFLLSRISCDWNSTHAEAVARLDRPEPIFWVVALHEQDRKESVRIGQSSYYSGLYVDSAGKLQAVNPDLGPSSLSPQCGCCTHTFNGVRFTRRFDRCAASTPSEKTGST